MTDLTEYETIEELHASEDWQAAGVIEQERLRSQWLAAHDLPDPAVQSAQQRLQELKGWKP